METPEPQRSIIKSAPKNSEPIIDDAATDLMSAMVQFAADLTVEANIQQMEKFRSDYQTLVRSLMRIVDSFFAHYNEAVGSPSTLKIIQSILDLMWNLSDKIPLVPMFLEGDKQPPLAAGWLEKLSFKEPIKELCRPTLSILYNLTRHRKGLQALREAKIFDLLMKRKSNIIESKNTKLKETFGMLLIALTESDEDQKENNALILEVSDKLFKDSEEARENGGWRCGGCHLSEYLYSLRRALSNTLVVRHLLGDSRHVEHKRIKFFGDLLCETYGLLLNPTASELDRFVIKFLLDIIFCISNYDDYRPTLKADSKLTILIETLAGQPHQDVAKRTFANLQLGENSVSTTDRTPKKKSPKIYISYNWTDKEFCEKLYKALQTCTNVPIWVALEHGDDRQDPWSYSGPAIDSATIIIVLVSNAYGCSSRNRQELTYALAKNDSPEEAKSLIIVETVPDFKYNQEWMHSSFREGEKVVYRKRMDEMAQMTADKVALLTKKRLFTVYAPVKTAQSRVCTVM